MNALSESLCFDMIVVLITFLITRYQTSIANRTHIDLIVCKKYVISQDLFNSITFQYINIDSLQELFD